MQGKSQLTNDQYVIDQYTVTKNVSKIYYEIVY